jgi:phospholipid-binding lipoprotein MlaA
MYKLFKKILLSLFLIQLLGCASYSNPNDPYESYNRGMYEFNDVLDKAILKPVATGYKFITPEFAEKGVSNFFNNIRDFITAVNDILQLEMEHAASDTGRVILNSTVGIIGLVDVHTMVGGERRKEDFGTTLASYGWNDSNYLVLPLFGPSTIRDGTGLIVDGVFIDPIGYINDVAVRNWLRVGKVTNARAGLLDATAIFNEATFDPYSFQRDSYLQYRDSMINKGRTINYDEYMDVVDSDYNDAMPSETKDANLKYMDVVDSDYNDAMPSETKDANVNISESVSSIGSYLKALLPGSNSHAID